MPLERIYRDISIKDSVHLDSFSKLRVSEPSDYDFFDFKYPAPFVTLNSFADGAGGQYFITSIVNTDIEPAYSTANKSIVFRKSANAAGAGLSFVAIKTLRLINVTRNSTIKAYIPFRFLTVASSNTPFVGIGSFGEASNYENGFIGLVTFFTSVTATNPLGISIYLSNPGTSTILNYVISKDDWEDRFDGTGPSGITLDFTKIQTLSIEYRNSGHGEITIGFIVGAAFYVAMSFYNVNTSFVDSTGFLYSGGTTNFFRPFLTSCRVSAGYQRSSIGTLPAGPATTPLLHVYGGIVFREDDPNSIVNKKIYNNSTSHTYPAIIVVGSSVILMRIKKIEFSSPGSDVTSPNVATATIDTINIVSTASTPLYWELVYTNSPTTPAPTFSTVNTNSLLQVSKPTSNTLKPTTSVRTVASGFIPANQNITYKVPNSIKHMMQLVNGITTSGIVTHFSSFAICVTPMTANTTANQIRVSVTTEEIYN